MRIIKVEKVAKNVSTLRDTFLDAVIYVRFGADFRQSVEKLLFMIAGVWDLSRWGRCK